MPHRTTPAPATAAPRGPTGARLPSAGRARAARAATSPNRVGRRAGDRRAERRARHRRRPSEPRARSATSGARRPRAWRRRRSPAAALRAGTRSCLSACRTCPDPAEERTRRHLRADDGVGSGKRPLRLSPGDGERSRVVCKGGHRRIGVEHDPARSRLDRFTSDESREQRVVLEAAAKAGRADDLLGPVHRRLDAKAALGRRAGEGLVERAPGRVRRRKQRAQDGRALVGSEPVEAVDSPRREK